MGDRRKCQTYTASPAEPGGLPVMLGRRSTSALQIAEHLLAQAATGERDLDRLKASALNELASQ
jgi:hypothetical protein